MSAALEMKDRITAVLLEKHEKKDTTMLARFPPITELRPCYLGSHSLTGLDKSWRYLSKASSVNLGELYTTEPELGRAYLTIKYPKRPPINRVQKRLVIEDNFRPPLYAVPGPWGECAYVDIVSAYWSIMSPVGWDVDYCPGRYVGQRSEMHDFPFPDRKLARNSMAVAGIAGNLTIWDGTGIKTVKGGGRHTNKIIWAYIMDVLNGVAHELYYECQAKYCMTDGYIIPIEHVARAQQIIGEWGLPSSIKAQGQTDIKAVAAYRVGEHTSKPYLMTNRDRPSFVVNTRSWPFLKARMAEYSDRWTRQGYEINDMLKHQTEHIFDDPE